MSAIVICIKHFSMTCERPLSVVLGILYLMYEKKKSNVLPIIFKQTEFFFEHYIMIIFYYTFFMFARICDTPCTYKYIEFLEIISYFSYNLKCTSILPK